MKERLNVTRSAGSDVFMPMAIRGSLPMTMVRSLPMTMVRSLPMIRRRSPETADRFMEEF